MKKFESHTVQKENEKGGTSDSVNKLFKKRGYPYIVARRKKLVTVIVGHIFSTKHGD